MKKPMHWSIRSKTSMFGRRLNYYASWWTCSSCGFKLLKQKHEEKSCDLCGNSVTFSHLILMNTKRIG